MHNLVLCTFCGHKPEIKFVPLNEPVPTFDKYYEIRCPICLDEGIYFRYSVQSLIDEKEQKKAMLHLIESWNRIGNQS